jgi:glyoxylase-like metal-dependent hydrolase (beta-lactamase superfamily II)
MHDCINFEDYRLDLIIQGNKYPFLHSTVVLLRKNKRCMLIDTGYSTDQSLLINNLEGLNVSPDEVTDLILTHLHLDHLGNVELFKNADIYIGKEDYETLKCICDSFDNDEALGSIIEWISNLRQPNKIRALKRSFLNNRSILEWFIKSRKRITLIENPVFSLDDRLTIKKSPGHTDGHIIVCCAFAQKICIAGDALPLSSLIKGKNWRDENIINQDPEKFEKTINNILCWAELIYPGHDKPFLTAVQ